MEGWFSEQYAKDVMFSVKVNKLILEQQSQFQKIQIIENDTFGKILVIDGFLMLTEKDEFIYHEMIAHVPMAVNPACKKVLVIGGGDGGTVRELVRYHQIEQIDLVEIDQMVVDVCKVYFPEVSSGFADKRVKLHFEDGVKFIAETNEDYDLIIIDSTDPFGPGEGLFSKVFYENCRKHLRENGILINQHESPYYEEDALAMERTHRYLHTVFPKCFVYQAHIPTYASGHWLFGFASNQLEPLADWKKDIWEQNRFDTRYYNSEIHQASFALPNYVKARLKKAEC